MIDIVLYQPEIPSNTGNIARTCAATGAALHLIKPLGFDISDKAVKRAGLDYWHMVDLNVYDCFDDYLKARGDENIWLATTKGSQSYTDISLAPDAALLFGRETKGLPDSLRARYSSRLIRIPIKADARSLNLANSAAILCFEALRQQGFPGLSPSVI